MPGSRTRAHRLGCSLVGVGAAAALALSGLPASASAHAPRAARHASPNAAFARASARTHVPVALLEAVCYFEGRLSMHGGRPSADHAYGCMHLEANREGHTLREASRDLGVSERSLKTNLAANVLGGAAVLRDEARSLSPHRALPANLAGWYGAVAAYGGSPLRSTALMQATAVYRVLHAGFAATADGGARVTLAGQRVRPDTATATGVHNDAAALPKGCKIDRAAVDYKNAVDCIVENKGDYDEANRPFDFNINGVVIHDTDEGPAINAIKTFQDPKNVESIQYLVGEDGTVYQLLPEKDIAYHDANYWSNEHTIGIEHAGYDATGWQWYNGAQYLGSAKLVAYALSKYHLPLDRAHVLAHGTVAPEYSAEVPSMHVDPGPYWLWDYEFGLIHGQGVPYAPTSTDPHVIMVEPKADARPLGHNGTETPANFGFTYLYTGPSTRSGLIPQLSPGDVTDVSDNVEPRESYYTVAHVKDPAGTGDTMYEIWYGENDGLQSSPPDYAEHGHLVWLAVPAGDKVVRGNGQPVRLVASGAARAVTIYGDPISDKKYVLGSAPAGALFDSGLTVLEDGTGRPWYELNYSHRQAYVPATSVAPLGSPAPPPK